VLSDSEVALNDHVFEKTERRSIGRSTQYVNKLLREFEGSTFKLHVFARRPIKDEAEVDVDQVTTFVNQNITVVSVFDLKNEAYNGICC
jgi:hypothetical protein